MNGHMIEAKQAPWSKAILIVGALLATGLAVGVIVENRNEFTVGHGVLVAIGLIFAALGGIHLVNRQVLIYSDRISGRSYFKTVTLRFEEIDKLAFDSNKIRLHSGENRLTIDGDIENREQVFRHLVDQIKDNRNLQISGNKDMQIMYIGRVRDKL